MPRSTARTRVLHVVYPGTKLLDLAGPLQIFHDAKDARGKARYETILVSALGGLVISDLGVELTTRSVHTLRVQATDIILVPGGRGVFELDRKGALIEWLRTKTAAARIVASTCTGAFALALAGLLDGRRAVTHWDDCEDLQHKHPEVTVDAAPIHIEDGRIWTSAGVTAGIDLTLAILERDLGREIALDIAPRLVVYSKRPGGQAQFSGRLQQQLVDERSTFEDLHAWVSDNLAADLRVETRRGRTCLRAASTAPTPRPWA